MASAAFLWKSWLEDPRWCRVRSAEEVRRLCADDHCTSSSSSAMYACGRRLGSKSNSIGIWPRANCIPCSSNTAVRASASHENVTDGCDPRCTPRNSPWHSKAFRTCSSVS
jgi:hypothetical protein